MKIANWQENYENNRSRTVKDLRWVPVPNRHDGERYARLMIRKDSAIIFSAWILMLQVASRCQPRGSLVRSDGKLHDPESLSLKTRAPAEWFEKAIPVLMEMAWLEQDAGGCQEAVRKVSGGCQEGDEERKKGMEGKEDSPEALELVNLLCSLMRQNDPKAKAPENIEAWKREARLLIDRDGRELSEAKKVMEWCQRDSFWRNNILSMPKFREKYPQLRLKAIGGGLSSAPVRTIRPSISDIESQIR